jgi:hypothetical protein
MSDQMFNQICQTAGQALPSKFAIVAVGKNGIYDMRKYEYASKKAMEKAIGRFARKGLKVVVK